MSDTQPVPAPVVPNQGPQPAAPVEPTALVGTPLPADLVQADPGLLVDTIHGSGAPQQRHVPSVSPRRG
jgi:hypothetical protein